MAMPKRPQLLGESSSPKTAARSACPDRRKPAQPPKDRVYPIEDPDLVILAWVMASPVTKEIEQSVRSGRIGLGQIVEAAIAWVHLVVDERLAIALREVPQNKTTCLDVHET